ncbi:cupin domain-containing protein [Agrobacterium tumefaciens]|uniref:cupin domain-containing protein n=1 Tax=Agrobacterium tumefaciens TaxID=358 RepID=UPI000EF278A9|nr:cupin domain-containing protein [Agrobacterium tumefaciens]AYM08013.1 cupin [Agrobacterium tumefaciens]NSZ34723.1 cupin domain-containing protein [Agrobacterium tumefaciens]QLG24473.1 cupin domain-containing protein [Agrobacterium tumefaciens]UXS88225.1 cupin domain-containing protein [Agrobacterium tumefaciens]
MFSIRRHHEPEPGESRTVRYEGCEYGSAVSIFLVNADPGRGPDLHVHPYAETWVVRKGEAEFTIGDQRARGSSGDIVVGPANIPHRFENIGTDRLEIICIHPSETFQQTFL